MAVETYISYPSKLKMANPDGTAVTNASWIAGHKCVKKKSDLYTIKDFILSDEAYEGNTPNSDEAENALGQLWYVIEDYCFYQLISWADRNKEAGWAKTNIKASTNPGGTGETSSETIGTDKASSEWLTTVTINGDGSMSYTSDGLHLNLIEDSLSYSGENSTMVFDVITGLDIDDNHTISYTYTKVTALSQSHHGGEIYTDANGGFITGVELSSKGKLSGEISNFGNSTQNNNAYFPTCDDYVYWSFANLDTAYTAIMMGDNGAFGNDAVKILTYAYIDNLGQLHTSYVTPLPWLTSVELKQSKTGKLVLVPKLNTPSLDRYVDQSQIDYNKEFNTTITIDKDHIGYMTFNEVPAATSTADGILSASTYRYFTEQINGAKNSTSGMPFYSDKTQAWGTYNGDGTTYSTYLPNASRTTYGVVYLGYDSTNAFPGDVGKANTDWIQDMEDRLDKKDTVLSKGATVGNANWTVYKADGTYMKTYSNTTSITIEYGCKFECTYSLGWENNGATNYGYIYSTSGVVNTAANSGNTKILSSTSGSWGTYNYSSTPVQITDRNTTKTFGSQTTSWYLGQTAKSLKLRSDGTLQKVNGAATTGTSPISFKVSTANGTCRWYGTIAINPATATVEQIKTAISGLSNHDVSWNKGISISASVAKTSDTQPYFIYVYPKSCGTLSTASVPGADATKWFNTTNPGIISITSASNGYSTDYYYVYSLNSNSLSGAKLTFA